MVPLTGTFSMQMHTICAAGYTTDSRLVAGLKINDQYCFYTPCRVVGYMLQTPLLPGKYNSENTECRKQHATSVQLATIIYFQPRVKGKWNVPWNWNIIVLPCNFEVCVLPPSFIWSIARTRGMDPVLITSSNEVAVQVQFLWHRWPYLTYRIDHNWWQQRLRSRALLAPNTLSWVRQGKYKRIEKWSSTEAKEEKHGKEKEDFHVCPVLFVARLKHCT